MKKLKISPSLTGTPLTEQELKSIIGGRMGFTRNCSCQFYGKNDEFIGDDTVAVEDEGECSEKCRDLCKDDSKCYRSTYYYTVTNA